MLEFCKMMVFTCSYVHHVAGNTVSEQLHHNPEVSLTAFTQSAHIVSLKQQLSLMTKVYLIILFAISFMFIVKVCNRF